MRTLLFALGLLLPACIASRSESGVINTWRDESTPAFEVGKTTQAEVAQALGPPSQLINLEDTLVFYYLYEKARKRGIVLIVYNTLRERVIYDRAIFFFDRKGILTDYALSLEEAELATPPKPTKKEQAEAPEAGA